MSSIKSIRFPYFTQLFVAIMAFWSLNATQAVTRYPAQDEDVFKIKTELTVFDWAVDPASNRVFASILNSDEVVEFNATMGTTVRTFSVGKNPEKMLVSGKRLIVLCQNPTQVVVIDLSSNKVESKIPIDCKNLCDVSATRKSDSQIYLFAAHSGKFGDPLIYQLDLDSGKVVETLKQSEPNREYIVNGVISEYGTGLIFDRRGYVSPSGAFFATVDSDEKTYHLNQQLHDSFSVINRGPADRFWTLGSELVNFDDLKTVRKFSGHLLTVHPTRDLAASLDVVEKRVDLWQFSSGKKLKSVSIADFDNQLKSSGTRKREWKYNRDVADPVLEFDQKNQFVFCGQRSTAFLIPYGEIAEQASSQTLIKPLTTRKLQVGKQIKQVLELTNDELTSKAEFELVSGPKSAKLNGRELVWTPGIGDIGEHEFVISGTANGTTDRLTANLAVQGNEVDLGITTRSWAVSPSGKYAVAWGVESNGRQGFGGIKQEMTMSLVIVDLVKGEIVNRAENDKTVQTAAIDDNYVYLIAQNSNVLHRHNIDDFDEKKRVFLPGTGITLAATEDEKLLVHYRDKSRGLSSMHQTVVDPATLKPNDGDPRSGSFGHSTSYFSYLPLEKGEATDGRHVYDTEKGHVKQILQPHETGLELVDQDALRKFQMNFGASMPTAKRWGRTYDRSSLKDGRGNQICQMQYPFSISTEFPIGVGFRSDQSRSGRNTTVTGEFKFFDLIEGAEIGTQTLFKSTGSNRSSYYPSGNQGELIQLRGKNCHTLFENKIYSAPIPAGVLAKVKTPLRISSLSSLHIDLGKPEVKIQLQTPGYEKVEFSLVNSVKYVELDEAGLLTIDTAKMWQAKLAESVSNTSPFARIRSSRNTNQQIDLQQEARRRYQIEDNQLGFLVPLSIKATGDDGQSDQIQFCLVALGNKAEIDQKKNLLAQQWAEQQRQMAEEQKLRQAMLEKARADAGRKQEAENRGERESESEVEELKKKVKRLEAVIDSLIGRLERLEAENKNENKKEQ